MGRTVNILEDLTDKVTTVEFTDSDGELYQITGVLGGAETLKLQRFDSDKDFMESVVFLRKDIDKLITLFQAVEQYNI